MRFVDLVDSADRLEHLPVTFEFLRDCINRHHPDVGKVITRAISNVNPDGRAYFLHSEEERTSAYGNPFTDVQINYCDSLDDDIPERRFVVTKELMHVFDSQEARTDTRESFLALMREVQNKPVQEHASEMFKSENNTRWMAAIVLCPPSLRLPLVTRWKNGGLLLSEAAEICNLPEWITVLILDDYFDKVYDLLVTSNKKA